MALLLGQYRGFLTAASVSFSFGRARFERQDRQTRPADFRLTLTSSDANDVVWLQISVSSDISVLLIRVNPLQQ